MSISKKGSSKEKRNRLLVESFVEEIFNKHNLSAYLNPVAGIVIILALLGSSAKNFFSQAITEDVAVMLKKDNDCVVEPSDGIPRVISNCSYAIGDILSITYKPQPTLEKYELKNFKLIMKNFSYFYSYFNLF